MPTKHKFDMDIMVSVPLAIPEIEKVIFNDPATVVIWADGSKTVVKCQEGDTFDKRIGLAMAICKKFFGNRSRYNDVFKKWVEEEEITFAQVHPGTRAFGTVGMIPENAVTEAPAAHKGG